ncbi:hypothetical protein ACFUOZ_20580 [Paenarthrobacter sp. NPDC057355]|uniref:hypothetical protein n=1 Tax=Paenarthrobacter sp. NPDC057355 TaxID=3346105 RepID=UPI00363D6CB5
MVLAGLASYPWLRQLARGKDDQGRQAVHAGRQDQHQSDEQGHVADRDCDVLWGQSQLEHSIDAVEASMEADAALVSLELLGARFVPSNEVPGFGWKYQARFFILNRTNKRLTDVQVLLPDVATPHGQWPAMVMNIPDIEDNLVLTPFADPVFPAAKELKWMDGDMTAINGPMGATEAFDLQTVLRFRVEDGPVWELLWDRERMTRPTLQL